VIFARYIAIVPSRAHASSAENDLEHEENNEYESIENTSIDPKVFLSQCVMMGNSLPATKHLTLSIEILQACSPPNFAQYAELWKNKPAELFDFVSVQFYNYGYPTDPTAEPSPNNPSGGDFPALLKLGFL